MTVQAVSMGEVELPPPPQEAGTAVCGWSMMARMDKVPPMVLGVAGAELALVPRWKTCAVTVITLAQQVAVVVQEGVRALVEPGVPVVVLALQSWLSVPPHVLPTPDW